MGVANSFKGILTRDFSYKLVALLITLLIWLLVLGRGHQTEDVNLKVEYPNLSKELMIAEATYDVIKVKIKGPPKLIRKFILANGSIKLPDKIDSEGVKRVRVFAKNLVLPYGLRVLSISPREIRIAVQAKSGE